MLNNADFPLSSSLGDSFGRCESFGYEQSGPALPSAGTVPVHICGPGGVINRTPFHCQKWLGWAMNSIIRLVRMFKNAYRTSKAWLASKGGVRSSFLGRPGLGWLQGWPVIWLHGVFMILGSPCASALPHKGSASSSTWYLSRDNKVPAALELSSTQYTAQRERRSPPQISACVSPAQPGSWATAEPVLELSECHFLGLTPPP